MTVLKPFFAILGLSFMLTVSSNSIATPNIAASSYDEQAIKKVVTESLGLTIYSIKDSPIPSLLELSTNKGTLYISQDGNQLIHGNIYAINDGMKNLTEDANAMVRVDMLTSVESEMLVYKAQKEQHVITVFTDITCGYCRKLHAEMKEYNDLGITVRYLAFPRSGVPSPSAQELESVWCAKDPLQAMTDAKAGDSIKLASCDVDIKQQYELGQRFGINGTPAIILSDGRMIPGYQPPANLIQILEQ